MTDPAAEAWRRPAPALLLARSLEWGVPLALGVVLAAALMGAFVGAAQALAVGGVGLAAGGLALAGVHRRWSAWGFLEREDDLMVRRGVLLRSVSVVPYARLQFVDLTAGPVERWLGVAKVTVHTASTRCTAVIPGLPADEAARLRDRLTALGERAAAGL